jgi:hypothetical protein
MHRRKARFVLPAVALALLIPLWKAAAEELPAPVELTWPAGSPPAHTPAAQTCSMWVGTDYFTDAAHTTRVGVCTLTCSQANWLEPTFSGGGSCTGSSSSFTLRRFFACPGPCL